MEAWGLSDKGNVREQNQDYYLIERLPEDAMLAVVCAGRNPAMSPAVLPARYLPERSSAPFRRA